MISAHHAYNLYLTIKKHYTNQKYDVFDKNPVKLPLEKFITRPERFRFDRLVRRFDTAKDLVQYYVANFALDTSDFLYQPEELGDSSYVKWETFKQSMSYQYSADIDRVIQFLERNNISVEKLFDSDNHLLLYLFSKQLVSVQSVVILNSHYNFLNSWVESSRINPLYKKLAFRAQKTVGFVKFNKDSLINITRGLESLDYGHSETTV